MSVSPLWDPWKKEQEVSCTEFAVEQEHFIVYHVPISSIPDLDVIPLEEKEAQLCKCRGYATLCKCAHYSETTATSTQQRTSQRLGWLKGTCISDRLLSGGYWCPLALGRARKVFVAWWHSAQQPIYPRPRSLFITEFHVMNYLMSFGL